MTDIKEIVRLKGFDLQGTKNVAFAITGIKGIGYNLAKAIVYATKIDKNKKIGELSDEDLKKLEDIINDPKKYNIPSWMLNRRKNYESGEDLHNIGSNLQMSLREDLNLLKKIRSYKGIRHEMGLPVRGQRTRSSFRSNKGKAAMKKKQV